MAIFVKTPRRWTNLVLVTFLALLAVASPLVLRSQDTPGGTASWENRLAALDQERAEQAGVAVSIVFDDSGSMNDRQKLVMAKEAFQSWIEASPDSYRFGLLAINAGTLVKLQRNDKAQILAAVNRLRARGGTPLADTIARAGKDIRARRAAGAVYERQVVVILTDGEDTSDRGIKGVLQEIRRLREERVEVIAFGYQGEGDYMSDSATHYYSPENGADIRQGLNAIGSEIGDTSDVVLDDATRAQLSKVAPAPAVGLPATNPPAPVVDTPAATPKARPFSPYASPTPTEAASATPVPRQTTGHRRISGWQIAALVGVFLVLRSIGRRR